MRSGTRWDRCIDRSAFVGQSFLLPSPNRGQEVGHVDPLAAHFDHPRVFEHTPGGGAAGRFFLKTEMNVS